jgi:hypothetical protein
LVTVVITGFATITGAGNGFFTGNTTGLLTVGFGTGGSCLTTGPGAIPGDCFKDDDVFTGAIEVAVTGAAAAVFFLFSHHQSSAPPANSVTVVLSLFFILIVIALTTF